MHRIRSTNATYDISANQREIIAAYGGIQNGDDSERGGHATDVEAAVEQEVCLIVHWHLHMPVLAMLGRAAPHLAHLGQQSGR